MKFVVFLCLTILAACTNEVSQETVDTGNSDMGILYDVKTGDVNIRDSSIEDTLSTRDTISQPDAGGSPDLEQDPDSGMQRFPTLADYRKCQSDVDCPVGLGECLKEVSLSRRDDTLGEVVLVSDVMPGLGVGEGICSRSCVSDESACQTLSLRNPDGEKVPFVCQVVAVGDLDYPDPKPDFPFQAVLDFDKMAMARPFAAICRPPFELDANHLEGFCGVCDTQSGCEGGVCWNFATAASVSGNQTGLCLEADQSGCPLGFESKDLSDGGTSIGKYCVPLTETCGSCQDRDGDGYGAGHCSRVEIDCDDKNENAFYDPMDMNHAFPAFCGAQDYNCNGLSDDVEQVGLPEYKQYHCEYCFDDLDGKRVQQGLPEEALLSCLDGVMVIQSCTEDTQIHCQGDVRVTGCEASAGAGAGGTLYYQDFDGDSFGNPNEPSLGCPGGAPVGYVTDNSDCDDSRSSVNPSITSDRCDCWGDCGVPENNLDNDCDGQVDEDVELYNWLIDADGDGAGESRVMLNGSPAPPRCGMVSPATVPQFAGTIGYFADCDNTRSDVYGIHFKVIDDQNQFVSYPLVAPAPRDADGNLSFKADLGALEVCDSVDNNCDGQIDEYVSTTYYKDVDGDSYGSPGLPKEACSLPVGYSVNASDCNDADPNINRGAVELCDGIDSDCDMLDDQSDSDIDLTTRCDTGLLGACSVGIADACGINGLLCSQTVLPVFFDDPSSGTDDDDCDGPEKVVYVDGTAGFDNPNANEANGDGLHMARGFKTIQAALTYAQSIGATQLFLRGGTYAISSPIVLKSGIDIVGGFDASGVYTGAMTTISKDSSVIEGNNIAVHAISINSPTTIAHLNVFTTQGIGAGTTNMGISLIFSNAVHLRDVNINVSDGSDGDSNTDPPPTEDISGPGFSGRTVTTGSNQWNHFKGSNTCPSTPGVDGLANGGDGLRGFSSADLSKTFGLGNGGGNGVVNAFVFNIAGGDATNVALAGEGGTARKFLVATTPMSSGAGAILKSSVGSPGKDGQFGGGGGGGSFYRPPNGSTNFVGPAGGAGGCPGKGGGASAMNGGSSIGVFAIESNVGYENVTIETGKGGDGGNGRDAADGGDGGRPSPMFVNAYSGSGVLMRGGYGSGGSGGGGGASGQGGYSFAVFISGFAPNSCNGNSAPAGVTVPTSSVAGLGGTPGQAGQGGEFGGNPNTDANDGVAGESGGNGNAAECHFARPCSQGCLNTEYCSQGLCFERF